MFGRQIAGSCNTTSSATRLSDTEKKIMRIGSLGIRVEDLGASKIRYGNKSVLSSEKVHKSQILRCRPFEKSILTTEFGL